MSHDATLIMMPVDTSLVRLLVAATLSKQDVRFASYSLQYIAILLYSNSYSYSNSKLAHCEPHNCDNWHGHVGGKAHLLFCCLSRNALGFVKSESSSW